MNIQRNKKATYLIVILLLLVIGIGIGYAAITSNLKVNGSSKIESARWGIEAEDIRADSGNGAEVIEQPSISNTDGMIYINYAIRFSAPGQMAAVNFNLRNTGTIDAVLKTKKDTSEQSEYFVTNMGSDHGEPFEEGTIIRAGEIKEVVIFTSLKDFDGDQLIIDNAVKDNFVIELVFEQA